MDCESCKIWAGKVLARGEDNPTTEPVEDEYKWPIAITSTELGGRYKHPASGDILRRVGMTSYVKSIVKNNRFLFINERSKEVWCYDENDFDLLSSTSLTTVGEIADLKLFKVKDTIYRRIKIFHEHPNRVHCRYESDYSDAFFCPDTECERIDEESK